MIPMKAEISVDRNKVRLLAGVWEPERSGFPPFSEEVVAFLDAFSRALRVSSCRTVPDAAALGFWCRRSHLEAMKKQQETSGIRLGRGLLFHLAPSNVPMMFFYTAAIGMLAGNSCIVRVSSRMNETAQEVIRVLKAVLETEEFRGIRERCSFVQYDRSDEITAAYLAVCDGRILWGGDQTVQEMSRLPVPPHAVTLAFPDRWSFALLDSSYVAEMGEEELKALAHRFYNDTFVMDQQGCSSPQMLVWVCRTEISPEEKEKGKERFWRALAEETEEDYPMDGFRAARKYENLCLAAMEEEELGPMKRYGGNRLFVLPLKETPKKPFTRKGGFGLFYEAEITSGEELIPMLGVRTQTIVCAGIDRSALAFLLQEHRVAGVDRIVEAGQALQMGPVWDGKNLIRELSREIAME